MENYLVKITTPSKLGLICHTRISYSNLNNMNNNILGHLENTEQEYVRAPVGANSENSGDHRHKLEI